MTEDTLSSTHPLLPPTTEDDRVSWLRLLRSYRVGVSTFYRLLGEHGSAAAALEALPEVARSAGVKEYRVWSRAAAEQELHAGRSLGARLIFRGEAGYPDHLASLADAPPMIWALGDGALLTRPCIGVIGARNASSLGVRMARNLARELGDAGLVVVSGLARGIDAAAHRGALETGTVAVQAGGIDILYPQENAPLAASIEEQGLRIAEQPPGLQPQARHFPIRNRIISGLCQAVVVVEAAAKSGSLITARNALDQGRDVLAVPGHPFDARAGGCNMLIRDGARLVRNAADVIEALGPMQAPVQTELFEPSRPAERSLRETARLHSDILERLGPSPLAEDQLMRDLNLAANAVSPALTELEMEGRIVRRPGGLISIAS